MQGFYVLRNDLTLLSLGEKSWGEDYPCFMSTANRSLATRFNSAAEAAAAAEKYAKWGKMMVIEF